MRDLDNIDNKKPKVLPVILCGGQGTRLWPLSRKSFPKQFLSINNLDNKSLLQNTQKRLVGIKDLIEPIVICNSEHRFIVAEQMREINTIPKSIILEPFGRNTAPAITLGALLALENYSNPNLSPPTSSSSLFLSKIALTIIIPNTKTLKMPNSISVETAVSSSPGTLDV